MCTEVSSQAGSWCAAASFGVVCTRGRGGIAGWLLPGKERVGARLPGGLPGNLARSGVGYRQAR